MSNAVTESVREFLDNPPDRPWELDEDEIEELTKEERAEYIEEVERYEAGVMAQATYLMGKLDGYEAREAQLEQYQELFAKQEEIIKQLHAALAEAREGDQAGGQLRQMLRSRNEELSSELAEVRFAQDVEEHNYEEGRRIEEQRAEHDRVRRELYSRYLNNHGTSTDLFRHIARSLTEEHGRPPTIKELSQQIFELSDGGMGPDVIEEHIRAMCEAGDLEREERISAPYGSDDAWVDTVMEGNDG